MSETYGNAHPDTLRQFQDRYGTTSRFPNFVSNLYFRLAGSQIEQFNQDFDTYLEPNDERILDLGCGGCEFMHYASKRGHTVIGLDINEQAIRTARKAGLDVRRADISKDLPFKDDEFDMIYTSQVIEHIMEPSVLMSESLRVLKPSGKLVIRTADFQRCQTWFYTDYTHCHPYTMASLYWLCVDNGFEVKEEFHGCANLNFIIRRIGNLMLLTDTTTRIYKTLSRLTSWELCVIARKPT